MSVTRAPVPSPTESNASPPRWARSIDVLCLVLVGLALIVAEWGGFRIRLGGVRIALTSAYRPLLLAAVLAIIRHFLSPGTPRYRDLPARIAGGWRTAPGRS